MILLVKVYSEFERKSSLFNKKGFEKTIRWYFVHHDIATVKTNLEKVFVER